MNNSLSQNESSQTGANTPKRAVLYARVATRAQLTDDGLTYQIRACMQFCQEHGYSVEQIYSEVADGKIDASHRPQLANLLRQAAEQEPPFDTVVIPSLDRLSRDYAQAVSILEKLNQHLIKVICVDGQEDSDIVAMIQAVKAEVAQIQRRMINERIKYGIAAKRAQREQQQ